MVHEEYKDLKLTYLRKISRRLSQKGLKMK